ncbi:MAG TPA: metal-dependent hydrolase [Thermoanaerobaculia bacterium]|nr:metal-dependent hydrolase [Thermoanaerobaculia bacterium]
MPTIFTHPAVALTRPWFGDLPRGAVLAAVAGSIVPDLDVIAFHFGIPYASPYGHRGITHSLLFAFVYSLLAALLLRTRRAFPFVFLCAVSHTLLDAMTNGGLGVALLAPFSNERFFFPWRPIRLSPIGARFFSERGLAVLVSEAIWVWAPCVGLGLFGKYVAQRERKGRQ